MSSTSSASASASASHAAHEFKMGPQFKVVGIILAVVSGLLIGSSFVFKKKGLLSSQAGGVAGEGVAYLKSWMWWFGMTLMILGEICNFAAYAFVEAIVVTPLGALSVVVCAVLAHFFLGESLTFFGMIGCALCILGSVVIALNGPKEETVGQIRQFQKLFLAPGFLAFTGTVILACLIIVFYFIPRYGKKSMLWYISVCSLIGGLSVSCTTGLGAAIVTSIGGDNQFTYWFTYFLLGFVAVTLVIEIYYLNIALAMFNTAMVTPTYYVIFTSCTLITSIILYQGLKAPVAAIITVIMGFLVICLGITILQMSKVDPTSLNKLDRKSTILLQASRQNTELGEKSVSGVEDPGMDALRGSFGAFGTIVRARSMRRMSMSSQGAGTIRSRHGHHPRDSAHESTAVLPGIGQFQRHQLWDPPVPRAADIPERISMQPTTPQRNPTIKFGEEDIRHHYPSPGMPGVPLHDTYPVRQHPPEPEREQDEERYDGLPTRGLATAPASQTQFRPQFVDPYEVSTSPPTASPYRRDTVSDDEISTSPPSKKHHHPFSRGSSTKRYPHGEEEDDREESVSLVNKDVDSDGSIRQGGIRLLPSTPGRRS